MGKRRADPTKGKTLQELVAFRVEVQQLGQTISTIISQMEENEMDFFPVLVNEVFNSKWPTVRDWGLTLDGKFKIQLLRHQAEKLNAARDAARATNTKGKRGKQAE